MVVARRVLLVPGAHLPTSTCQASIVVGKTRVVRGVPKRGDHLVMRTRTLRLPTKTYRLPHTMQGGDLSKRQGSGTVQTRSAGRPDFKLGLYIKALSNDMLGFSHLSQPIVFEHRLQAYHRLLT